MATYYADLDLTGTGGDGSLGNPWYADTFQTQMASEGYISGTIFKIKGKHRYTSNFNFYSQGEVGVWHDGYILENWDEDNPWRISSSGDIVSKGGRNKFYNCIMYCDANFVCMDSSEFYDCFIFPNLSFYVNGTAFGANVSNVSIVKGCAIVDLSKVVTIQCSTADATLNVYDSVMHSGHPALLSLLAVFTSTNCVFVVNPNYGTHINVQLSWAGFLTVPSWDSPLSSFVKSILNYDTILSGPGDPRPGIGYPTYTGYNKTLSGSSRNDIGAYSDSDITTTVAPTTTTEAPTTTTAGPTTTTEAPTTTPGPGPVIDIKDLSGDINVIDFKISSISEPVLSVDFNQTTVTFKGVANPENTDVDLTAYEYSIDDGITWNPMTTESATTGLTFSPTGENIDFVWDIKEDLGNSIYNVSIKIRFRNQATFDSEVILSDYKIRSIYIYKKLDKVFIEPTLFSKEYTGIPGWTLMKRSPK